MGRATIFLYPALPSRFKSLLNATGNLNDLTVASSQYDMLLCSETLVSDMRHVSELLVPGYGCRLVVPGKVASGLRYGGIRTRWIWSILPTQV